MIKAILYTSNTGFTAAYAKLLGEELHLPVLALSQAEERIPKGSEILYLGWLMAGEIKGYRRAAKHYHIKALCAVGMGGSGTQLKEIRQKNRLPQDLPLFTLQGGFDRQKLRGVYRLMMDIMAATAGKKLEQNQNKTPEEADMLELMLHGGSRVDAANLNSVFAWYRAQEK
ncbi:MAG: hypothetical protein ACOYB8_11435 [Eubacteriaceae bacterium]